MSAACRLQQLKLHHRILPAVPARWQFLIDVIPIQIAAERFAAVLGEDPDSFRLCSYIVEDEGGLRSPAEGSTSERDLAK